VGGSAWFDLGAWIEAARVAVATGQDEFVGQSAAMVRRLREDVATLAGGVEVARMLEELERSPRNADPERMRETLSRIILTAGR
jgi:hypothetical protein